MIQLWPTYVGFVSTGVDFLRKFPHAASLDHLHPQLLSFSASLSTLWASLAPCVAGVALGPATEGGERGARSSERRLGGRGRQGGELFKQREVLVLVLVGAGERFSCISRLECLTCALVTDASLHLSCPGRDPAGAATGEGHGGVAWHDVHRRRHPLLS